MIPADKWPEWADRHCWDWNGYGWFHGTSVDRASGQWIPEYVESRIPIPDGHDWRVPVMRPTVKDSFTVDLEQFRDAVEDAHGWCGFLYAFGRIDWDGKKSAQEKRKRLLALIDGQKDDCA